MAVDYERLALLTSLKRACGNAQPAAKGAAALVLAARTAQLDGIDAFGWEVLVRIAWEQALQHGPTIDRLSTAQD